MASAAKIAAMDSLLMSALLSESAGFTSYANRRLRTK
jgi:hypothetical protein